MCILIAGYPRLLSGDLTTNNIPKIAQDKQTAYFPETPTDRIWLTPDRVKRYHLNFPFYPFRTLCPRDMQFAFKSPQEFDPTSPIFPANTQLNIIFHRRRNIDFLLSMIPYALNPNLGSTSNELSLVQRAAATSFSLSTDANPPVVTEQRIQRVDISIQNMYLQVQAIV